MSIIKESYYINQANAELIDYLKAKMDDKIKQNASKEKEQNPINFQSNFSFQSYNKFNLISSEKTNTEKSSSKTYKTGLVTLICDEFGIHTKDILISCITNNRDVNKAMGSIDTLLLVKDLKST
jgi:hypothetical protein